MLFQFSLFLLIGAMLWVFYRLSPPRFRSTTADRIFPTFIVNHMPHGISGLLIAAILAAAMSNLSAALNSLSSTTDARLLPAAQASNTRVAVVCLLSRMATIGGDVVLFALAILSRHGGKVVELGLSIASVAYGALLGVFLLGVLTRRANETRQHDWHGGRISAPISISGKGAAVLQWLQRATGCALRVRWRCRGRFPSPGTCRSAASSPSLVGYSSSLLLASPNDRTRIAAD